MFAGITEGLARLMLHVVQLQCQLSIWSPFMSVDAGGSPAEYTLNGVKEKGKGCLV